MVSSLLANALEAVGRFKWIYTAQITMVAINVTGAAVAISVKNWIPIVSALLLAIVMQHCVHVALSARAGYLDLVVLVRHYLAIALTSAIAALVAWGIVRYAANGLSNAWAWVICAVLLILTGCAAWRFRLLLPPLRLAKKFGILG